MRNNQRPPSQNSVIACSSEHLPEHKTPVGVVLGVVQPPIILYVDLEMVIYCAFDWYKLLSYMFLNFLIIIIVVLEQ